MTHELEYEYSPPSASAMLESLRAYGYSLNSAIADLIDNSITAQAGNVWITLHWDGSESWISIRDDGNGMTEQELSKAMVAGSQNPLDPREKNDLGRFGLGLKTASLSQARVLTVISKKTDHPLSIRRWDLDYIAEFGSDEWRLLKSSREKSHNRFEQLNHSKSGTVVLLENLDKLCGKAKASNKLERVNFYHKIDSLKEHLAMIFHRFLTPPNQLKIYINGKDEINRIKPWDPFYKAHPATDTQPLTKISYDNKSVAVQGYILPHKDRLTSDEYELAAGPGGWNNQQGFYIYRNNRLLVGGSWLGLRDSNNSWRSEEHYKLARIQVNITNDMDSDWQIDVKKSIATPPGVIGSALVDYAGQVRKKAREVFAHRGKYGRRKNGTQISKVWVTGQRKGINTYRLDRSHPIIKSFLEKSRNFKDEAETLLKLIEETVPVERIWLDSAETPEKIGSPFFGVPETDILKAAEQSLSLLGAKNSPHQIQFIDMICELECFIDHQDLIYAHFGK